ncbi:hypothetical protein JA33_293 [Dickeya phage vB_DsoM_JA33]|uniref:Uncharacterized protein n=3 Tax=Salmondvirus JA11 TaxID=2734141 RepID=A0A384ZWR9_9CAUD|nr:hypothetical protein HOU32_gp292 [Dickeya phage vB_DsoM_JA11]AXG66698.1 hypothetical protein JA13_295 [Dickeya phage vB_DsoM_JA13]AXG67667.1 hypothetical protein JA33_293 [Dickeya phage vB_DsoM_JA33]AYD80097.1 hypothetical protein JA11_292 [Dickeya phage vB_DsoM_JA11]
MRYELNKPYVFFAAQTVFEDGRVVEKMHAYQSTNPNDELRDIKFVVAQCKEHHKVPWDQDPKGEKKYDGFIFELPDGEKATNQYPHASYGQMSDTADGVISLLSHYYEKFDKDFDKISEADVYIEYFSFQRHMEALESAIYKFSPEGDRSDPEYHAKLVERRNLLISELAKQLNMTIQFSQYSVTTKDGSVIAPPGLYRSELAPLCK